MTPGGLCLTQPSSSNSPSPPTANTYWRHVGSKVLISAKGRQYREAVIWAVRKARGVGKVPPEPIVAPVAAVALWWPPDLRRRDGGGNLSKAPWDALTHAGLWADDSLVVDERWVKRGVQPGGRLLLVINEASPSGMALVEAQVLGGKTPPER